MFPENIVQATFQQVQTNYIQIKPKMVQRVHNTSAALSNLNVTSTNSSSDTVTMKPELEYANEAHELYKIVPKTLFLG